MYRVRLSNCYSDEIWLFEDYDTASLFARIAIDSSAGKTEARISRVQEEKQDEKRDESL